MADALTLSGAFKRALDRILARVFVSVPARPIPIAVAYSGGLDSTVLLHLAHDYAQEHRMALLAFHVHHGLSANADAWLVHCKGECARLGVTLDVRRVHVKKEEGGGLEAAARSARYAAMGEQCGQHGVQILLTAHHQDDQAETVLLQMLRGAGLSGMSGMEGVSEAPDLLGRNGVFIARPLLDTSRNNLSDWASERGIAHVEDESNQDTRHPRNALRNLVLPMLAGHFPAYRECVARSVRHVQAGQRLLDELARQDLLICRIDNDLDNERLKELDSDRIDNLLRYWLAANSLRKPSSAWLLQARQQLLEARADAQVCVWHDGVQIRRYRNRIMLAADNSPQPAAVMQPFQWQGQSCLSFPALGGRLHFDPGVQGVDAKWLRQQTLLIGTQRRGGKLKLAQNRPSRILKDHYQERGIPPWERKMLPLVFAGDVLLFAAGIGLDCRFVGSGQVPLIRLRWEQDAAFLCQDRA